MARLELTRSRDDRRRYVLEGVGSVRLGGLLRGGATIEAEGLAWEVDMYQVLYVVDLKEKLPLYRRPLDLDGFTHYNALAVAASPTLVGRHVFIGDNQGTTLVLDPGRELKVIAKNRLATQLDRPWPIPPQETLAYAPPITDGRRLYLRGERYLYCIGEK